MPHCHKKFGGYVATFTKEYRTRQASLYRKTGGSPDSSHTESQTDVVQNAQELIQDSV
jgi:hypothetical protein